MNKPTYEILSQADVQCEVSSYKRARSLIWPILFPLRKTLKFDLKSLEGNDGIPISADRVAFNTKAPIKSRRKIGSWSGRLAKMGASWEKDEIDINEYEDLYARALADGTDTEAKLELYEQIFDDAQTCAAAMDYKVEIDALRIGSHGVQTFPAEIEGDMATADEINFNVPEQNFKGVTAENKKWSVEETADGIADIFKAAQKIEDAGGRKPLYAFMEREAFEKLAAQKKTQKRLFPAAYASQTLLGDEVTVEAVNAYMRKHEYPKILIFHSVAKREDENGNEHTIYPWAKNVVVLSPEPRLGYTAWKKVPLTKNTAAYQSYGAYYLVTMYSDINPRKEVTMAESYFQPVLTNRKSLVFINTEHTAWNGGETAE